MFSQLQYDVPIIEVRNRKGGISKQGVVPNPSGALRRIAIRTSGSVWVVPDDRIPWNLIAEWDRINTLGGPQIIKHLVPYASDKTAVNVPHRGKPD